MRIKITLLLLILSLSQQISAQVPTVTYPERKVSQNGIFQIAQINTFRITPPDVGELLKQDLQQSSNMEKPFRFAESIPITINPLNYGNWTTSGDWAYWTLKIVADSATSLSIVFSRFKLTEGAVMYISNGNGTMLTGPITASENNNNSTWGSDVYSGDAILIEIKIPVSEKESLLLEIGSVAYGYKNIFSEKSGFGQSGSCNINVLCTQGTPWANERKAVCKILNASGTSWCSGSMVMNTCNTNMPYLLTACHCYVAPNAGSVSQWRFIYHYWSPTCSPTQDGDTSLLFNGAQHKAHWSTSDFALLQLNQIPSSSSDITYAGWTNSSVAATSGTGIHHPNGDVMKISLDYDPLTRNADYGWDVTAHWQVAWDDGVTEGGSSGSPLFDQSHRIIGQLHGGPSVCGGSVLKDYYGSFDMSWTGGGTDTTRLSNWLDPGNTGTTSTNTTNVSALTDVSLNLSISGADNFCSGSELYTLNGVPPGLSVTWSSSNPSIATISATGNPATVTKVGSGTVTVTGTVSGSCILTSSKTKTLHIGTPDMSNVTISQPTGPTPPCIVLNQPNRMVVLNSGGATTPIEVANSYGAIVSASQFGPNAVVTNPLFWVRKDPSNPNSYVDIKVRLQNDCGWSDWKIIRIYVCSSPLISYYMVSPNPSSDDVTIFPASSKDLKSIERTNIPAILNIEVYDQSGVLQKKIKAGAGIFTTKVNVANLLPGAYYFKITTKLGAETHTIIIQR